MGLDEHRNIPQTVSATVQAKNRTPRAGRVERVFCSYVTQPTWKIST